MLSHAMHGRAAVRERRPTAGRLQPYLNDPAIRRLPVAALAIATALVEGPEALHDDDVPLAGAASCLDALGVAQ
jgi:hypothetical protein